MIRAEREPGPTILQVVDEFGNRMRDAAQEAVHGTTVDTKLKIRAAVAGALGATAGNLVGHKFEINTDKTVVGWIHSRWWRKGARGQAVDILEQYETGATIRAQNKKWLAIPLPAAGKWGPKRTRITPARFAARVGISPDDLTFVPIQGGSKGLLVWDQGRLSRATGGVARRRAATSRSPTYWIPVFLLLKMTRLPKKLSTGPIRQSLHTRLAERMVIEMQRRGIG